MSGELGKASLDLEAELTKFEANIKSGGRTVEGFDRQLESLAAIANVAESALNDVGLSSEKAAESRVSAEAILSGVRGISDESRTAAREIDRVKLSEEQAAESEAAGGLIDHVLNSISRNADQAKRKLAEVRLAGGRNGVGVGPFGSGFGRVGLLGTAVGLGAITAPAAAPGAAGLLAGILPFAAAGAGAIGTLALAFKGLGKAIGGDKKAFEDLSKPAQQFVLTVRSLDGFFDRLRKTAAASLFPGLTKGLKAALSPGTVNALFTAVTQIGRAIGQVGAQFGRYFGSKEFQSILGPLMQSAARNIGVLGDAFLHLFDALGVLARAAIPFTNWLSDAIDKGAKLADAWLHAQDASGGLARGLNEAERSLRLVGGLFVALLRVVGALGQALYPIAKVAIKALTDGLNALAGIIHRNQSTIQGIVGGALRGFVGIVKLAAKGVGTLWDALQAILGHKGTIIAAIAAIGVAITLAIGPEAAAITGALVAIGLIRSHWAAIVGFFKTLGREIINAFKYAWYIIEIGAIKAALQVVEPFSHLPGVLGGWARRAKNSMQNELDRLHPPNMDWSKLAARDGAITGAAWNAAFAAQTAKNQAQIKANALNVPPLPFDFWLRQHPGGTRKQYDEYVKAIKLGETIGKEAGKHHHHGSDPKPGTHAWFIKYLGYDPTQMPTYGPPPPFKTTPGAGSKSAIPQPAAYLEALARRQDQQAAALNYTGKKAREHLNKEIADLESADKILAVKLKGAHGARRTQLFDAITANEKKIAEARKRLRAQLNKSGSDQLNLALDQAKLAVENAQQGTKAYDAAVAAEEKALKAEIRYWDKRAHNDKLSAAARDAALREELKYQKQLKALLAPVAQAAAANEAQFLSTFVAIQNSFAPNAFPVQPPAPSGKTNTHLHDIKNAVRDGNRHLQAIRTATRFPGSAAAQGAAMAVGG